MDTAVINIRTNSKLKRAAMKVAEDLGFNLSSLINSYLKTLVKTKTVYVSDSEEPSKYLIEALREAEEERKRGNYYSFKNTDEALKFLDDVIAGK
jgi:addiction module RelB/DinJ family antitoxin